MAVILRRSLSVLCGWRDQPFHTDFRVGEKGRNRLDAAARPTVRKSISASLADQLRGERTNMLRRVRRKATLRDRRLHCCSLCLLCISPRTVAGLLVGGLLSRIDTCRGKSSGRGVVVMCDRRERCVLSTAKYQTEVRRTGRSHSRSAVPSD